MTAFLWKLPARKFPATRYALPAAAAALWLYSALDQAHFSPEALKHLLMPFLVLTLATMGPRRTGPSA